MNSCYTGRCILECKISVIKNIFLHFLIDLSLFPIFVKWPCSLCFRAMFDAHISNLNDRRSARSFHLCFVEPPFLLASILALRYYNRCSLAFLLQWSLTMLALCSSFVPFLLQCDEFCQFILTLVSCNRGSWNFWTVKETSLSVS